MWNRIKWWLLRPISKATFYWKDNRAAIHIMYFYDNSIYVRLVGRTGYEMALVLPEEYVKDVKHWLDSMYEEEASNGGNKKIVSISKFLPLRKPPSSPT
jgi:hypothetical protein